MADLTGGQPVARSLKQAGVDHVFTLCGGPILPIYDGCLTDGALTAKLLRPDQRVLLVSGDGAFGLNGMELETAVRVKLPFTSVIGNDGGWGQIRSPQVSFFGEGRTVATWLPTTRYDLMGRGAYVTDPGQIGSVLARALASDEV
jgi:thiamine pyrophosphate-dependent acetolactate synthase large subunit-like protein